MSDFNNHIIIDNGSHSIKIGFNAENAPRFLISSVIGKIKSDSTNYMLDNDSIFIGNECYQNADFLNLNYPLIKTDPDFDDLEEIWRYALFNQLKISPESHNIFLTENSISNIKNREKMAQIMFETFNVFNIHIEPQGSLSLFSTAKNTGLVIESDHLGTDIIPIYEKFIISNAVRHSNLGGLEMTKQFEKSIKNKLPFKTNTSCSLETARIIKESFIKLLPETEMVEILDPYQLDSIKLNTDSKQNKETFETFTLPDGNKIDIGNERFTIPFSLFYPELIGKDEKGLDELIAESILNCDINIRKEMANNILIFGGNSLICNFAEVLKKQVEKRLGKQYDGIVKISANKDRKYAVWTGSSVVCSNNNFQYVWVSKNDYEDYGISAFQRNFIF